MILYAYPKVRHVRTESPPEFTDYRKFKPFLLTEFGGRCVYCRASVFHVRVDAFGVDHYLPKSDFPALATAYKNLYFCCNTCNRLKSTRYKSEDGRAFVPNPCDHVMFSHLQFRDEVIEPKTESGIFVTHLLDLNEKHTLDLRAMHLRLLASAVNGSFECKASLARLEKDVASGAVSEAMGASERTRLQAAHAIAVSAIDALTR